MPWVPLTRLARDDRGLTTVEYAICLCLIAAAAVGAWNSFGDHVLGSLERSNVRIEDQLTSDAKPAASE